MTGLFITLEGIDRSGKGTQLKLVTRWLVDLGYTVVTGHEPNPNNPVGRYIQRILNHELPAPSSETFQRLYILDRAQDLICYILPALRANSIVLWDRFTHSSIAYATFDRERVVTMFHEIMGEFFRWPDLTVILDIPAEEALRRSHKDQRAPEYFEKLDRLQHARERYLAMAGQKDIGSTVLVNGSQPPKLVFQELQQHVHEALAARGE